MHVIAGVGDCAPGQSRCLTVAIVPQASPFLSGRGDCPRPVPFCLAVAIVPQASPVLSGGCDCAPGQSLFAVALSTFHPLPSTFYYGLRSTFPLLLPSTFYIHPSTFYLLG